MQVGLPLTITATGRQSISPQPELGEGPGSVTPAPALFYYVHSFFVCLSKFHLHACTHGSVIWGEGSVCCFYLAFQGLRVR